MFVECFVVVRTQGNQWNQLTRVRNAEVRGSPPLLYHLISTAYDSAVAGCFCQLAKSDHFRTAKLLSRPHTTH